MFAESRWICEKAVYKKGTLFCFHYSRLTKKVKGMDCNGVLKVKVIRGKNLAVRDLFSSDPYVKIKLLDQVVKTHVKKRTLNPEWNEELTLCIPNTLQPLRVYVYDYDAFSADDGMGDAEIDLHPLLRSARKKETKRQFQEEDMVLEEVVPDSCNNLAQNSFLKLKNEHVVQEVCVKLKNVESGEIQLELVWIPPH